MTVKVQRVRGVSYAWGVRCSTCTGDGMWGLLTLGPGDAWVLCRDWPTAMVMARWHRRLHDQRRCGTCCHEPAIAKPTPVKDNLFKWDGDLYAVVASEVREMQPTGVAA